jgi:ATP-binding cassette, subfamily B, bacterial CvaB/MchF/RaxB
MAAMTPVLQSQAAECSLACLAMVASAHGLPLSLHDLRQRFPVGLKGSNLQQLMGYAAQLGLAARPVRLEMQELSRLSLPSILHWDLNHFVVLKKVGRKALTILDPAIGERKVSIAEASRHFTGVALELAPSAQFTPQRRAPRVSLQQLTGRVQGLGASLLAIGSVALVLELFAIAAPLLNQMVVDEAIASNDRELLTVLVLGFSLLLVVQTGLSLARSWLVMVLGQTLSLQWVGNVFGHLVRLPVAWFEQRHLGDISSRFGAVHAIQQTLTGSLIEAVLDGVMVVAALVMMWLYSPKLTVVVLGAVAVYVVVRFLTYRVLREASSQRMIMAARENSHFLETLRAITPLKLFGREEERRAQWQNLQVEVQNRDATSARMNIVFNAANALIFGLENLCVLWLAARMIMGSAAGVSAGPATTAEPFTVGMMFAFLSYKGQFTTRISALIQYGVQIRMLSVQTERLADIALSEPERDTPRGHAPVSDLSHLPPSIELRNVSFRYGPGEPWVLQGAHLRIEAGESVAVTGPSGAGKTTLLKILLGILEPTQGQVLYGGVPIKDLGLANVRRQIGTVMQDDTLLTGSLADNIAFFDPQPDTQRVEACARLAQLHDDVVRMPMGYRTLVGDLGAGLSGGQKQRVLLARALYRAPKVLAMDEATSHLDGANERAFTQALSRLEVTRLVIAHRQETIAGAQRVVQVRDGVVQEVMRASTATSGPSTEGSAPSFQALNTASRTLAWA